MEPNDEDKFIENGGDSLKAVILTDILQSDLKKVFPSLNFNKILDILLSRKYKDLVDYLTEKINERHEIYNDVSETKRLKLADLNSQDTAVIEWISKLQQKNSSSTTNTLIKEKKFKIEIEWKFNLQKCVDATPLLVKFNNFKKYILIGSHSCEFFCISFTGELVWSFKTLDRIESSAIVSKCGKFVVFGCYDSYVYVLGIENGNLEFKVKTEDIVKSSPCLNQTNGNIYFGSYDKILYCISIMVIHQKNSK